MKNALIQLPYFGQNTLFINNPHETTGEYLFLKLYKKYYNIIQLMTLYLIFHKFISIFLAQGGLRVRDTLYLAEMTLYYTVLHCTATVLLLRYCTTLHYAVLHCTTLYCYCTAL